MCLNSRLGVNCGGCFAGQNLVQIPGEAACASEITCVIHISKRNSCDFVVVVAVVGVVVVVVVVVVV